MVKFVQGYLNISFFPMLNFHWAISETQNELSQMTESLKADVLQDKIINLIKKHKDEYTIAVAKENGAMLAKVFNTLRYEVVLNINQY